MIDVNKKLHTLIGKLTFRRHFFLLSSSHYEKFLTKLEAEFAKKFPDKICIKTITLSSKFSWNYWRNRSVSIKGEFIFGPNKARFDGSIIWLANLNVFRGSLWHSLKNTSGEFCLNQARVHFRNKQYKECLSYIDSISDEALFKQKSVCKLRELAMK